MSATSIRLGVANKAGKFPDSKGVATSTYISYCPDYSLAYPTVSPDFLDKFGGYFGDLFELDAGKCHIVTKTKYHFTISLTNAGKSPIIADLGNTLRIMSKEDSIKFKFSPCEKEYDTVSEFSTLKFINMGDDSKQTDFVFGPNCKSMCNLVKKFGVKDLSKEYDWTSVMYGNDYVLSTNSKYLRKGGRRWNAMKALSDFYKNLDDDCEDDEDDEDDEDEDDCGCEDEDDDDEDDEDDEDEDDCGCEDEDDEDEDDEDEDEDEDEDDDEDCSCDEEEQQGGAKKAPVSVQKGASKRAVRRAARRAAKKAAKKAAKMSAGAPVTAHMKPVGGAPVPVHMKRVGGAPVHMKPVGGAPVHMKRVGGAPVHMKPVGGARVPLAKTGGSIGARAPVAKTGGSTGATGPQGSFLTNTVKRIQSVLR